MTPRKRDRRRRRGAALIEAAVVLPVFMLFLLGTLSLAMGVFRYGQLPGLAWEGARWASVRGPDFQKDQGANSKPTDAEVAENLDWRMLFGLGVDESNVESELGPNMTTVSLGSDWTPLYNPTVPPQEGDDPSTPARRVFESPITLNGVTRMPTLYFRTD